MAEMLSRGKPRARSWPLPPQTTVVAELIGVTPQTTRNWRKGACRPWPQHRAKLRCLLTILRSTTSKGG
jgi:hypothetical protein